MITGCYTKIGMFNKEADILYMDEVHGSLIEGNTSGRGFHEMPK